MNKVLKLALASLQRLLGFACTGTLSSDSRPRRGLLPAPIAFGRWGTAIIGPRHTRRVAASKALPSLGFDWGRRVRVRLRASGPTEESSRFAATEKLVAHMTGQSFVPCVAMLRIPVTLALATALSIAVSAGQTGAAENSPQPADTVPEGTVISTANWQSYARFMPAGMQAIFAGDHFWRMPTDVRIEIGPTIPIALPNKFLDDTAIYAKQVKLTQAAEGGYVPVGYVAGIPFPQPDKDPVSAPYEIFYDAYYHYAPRLQRNFSCNYVSDPYGNFTQSETADAIYSQLTHLSDAGFPQTLPDSHGYFLVKYYQQISPEQGKYTTSLDMSYADVTRLDELYMYLPSARRPLRMSQASRCSPVPGSDFTYEESNNGPPSLPQEYKITYAGIRRIMVLAHADPKVFENCGGASSLPSDYFYPADKGVLPWPRPALGKWEMREMYVIEMNRLPAYASGYCYGRRVIYVDKETLFPVAIDLYDPAGGLYKFWLGLQTPLRVPGTGTALGVNGATELLIANFRDKHMTVATAANPCFNTDCNVQYLDVSRYASPEGLSKIAQ
jgi:hypothetical protein